MDKRETDKQLEQRLRKTAIEIMNDRYLCRVYNQDYSNPNYEQILWQLRTKDYRKVFKQ